MTDTPPAQPTDRPLVTFALFAYNQEHYIREAVEGAFAQTYQPLEIILSDDCSTDRTYQIMQEMAEAYDGPHEVRVRQNEVNLGLGGHVNTVVKNSRGKILLLAAGDDVSLPDRTTVSVNLLKENPNATAALLSADVIDHSGKIIGERTNKIRNGEKLTQTINDLLSWKHVTFGATRAVRREIFTIFGPLNDCCPTEDTPILLRSLICGTNVISQHKAILYRKHDNNLSGAVSLKKMNISAIYQQYQKDVDTAEKLDLIESKLANKLRNWLPLDHKIRILKLNAFSDEKIRFRDIILLVQHPSINLRDKIKILVRYFASPKILKS